MAKFVFPQAEGKAAATYVFSALAVFVGRALNAEDQHVLGHPAFVARDVRRDPQRKTLLPQQRIAAIS